MKTKYFECDCCNPMHILRIAWFEDEWMKEHNCEKELYITVLLNKAHPW